jgi:hypothetical protein
MREYTFVCSDVFNASSQTHVAHELWRHAVRGLTAAELRTNPNLSSFAVEDLQLLLDDFEKAKIVTCEDAGERGKVYRPLVFDTVEDLSRAKASTTNTSL